MCSRCGVVKLGVLQMWSSKVLQLWRSSTQSDSVYFEEMWFATTFCRNLSSLRHVLQKSLNPPFPVTVKHSCGNASTLWRGLTVLGSVDSSPRALHYRIGGGLESTLHLR